MPHDFVSGLPDDLRNAVGKNATIGGEFQWARRENFSDGFKVSVVRLQFSFKYSFAAKVGG